MRRLSLRAFLGAAIWESIAPNLATFWEFSHPCEPKRRFFEGRFFSNERAFLDLATPTLVIEYDELWDDIGRIASFLSLEDTSFCEDFPAKTKRRNLR